jgi:hypothetical protein
METINYTIYLYVVVLLLILSISFYVYIKAEEAEERRRCQEGFDIGGLISKFGQMFMIIVEEIPNLISNSIDIATNFVQGFSDFGEGAAGFSTGLLNVLIDMFSKKVPDFGIGVYVLGMQYFECAPYLISNFFTGCFLAYLFDLFRFTVYLPFMVFFWMFGLQKMEIAIWNSIYSADKFVYNITGGHDDDDSKSGFHFAHYPCFIIDKCYKCKIKNEYKLTPKDFKFFSNKTRPLIDDITPGGYAYETLYPPFMQMFQGAKEMLMAVAV